MLCSLTSQQGQSTCSHLTHRLPMVPPNRKTSDIKTSPHGADNRAHVLCSPLPLPGGCLRSPNRLCSSWIGTTRCSPARSSSTSAAYRSAARIGRLRTLSFWPPWSPGKRQSRNSLAAPALSATAASSSPTHASLGPGAQETRGGGGGGKIEYIESVHNIYICMLYIYIYIYMYLFFYVFLYYLYPPFGLIVSRVVWLPTAHRGHFLSGAVCT